MSSDLLQPSLESLYGTKVYERAPSHIAIVMDGNRRWATSRGLPAPFGHFKGAEVIKSIVDAAIEQEVKVLTLFAFSKENWKRTFEEVEALMHLFENYILEEREDMLRRGVRFHHIGDLDGLPESLRNLLIETQEYTKNGKAISLVLAINYGGRDEICRAAKRLISDIQEKKRTVDEISEGVFEQYLDTAAWSSPDLVIRTGGEKRISNFLLWQISYSELYTTPVYWPDFSKEDLFEAIEEYKRRERRRGK